MVAPGRRHVVGRRIPSPAGPNDACTPPSRSSYEEGGSTSSDRRWLGRRGQPLVIRDPPAVRRPRRAEEIALRSGFAAGIVDARALSFDNPIAATNDGANFTPDRLRRPTRRSRRRSTRVKSPPSDPPCRYAIVSCAVVQDATTRRLSEDHFGLPQKSPCLVSDAGRTVRTNEIHVDACSVPNGRARREDRRRDRT